MRIVMTAETNTTHILDRNMGAHLQKGFPGQFRLMRNLVDYGVSLLDRGTRDLKTPADLAVKAHFIKHFVMLLDAIEIQLSAGAAPAAVVTARTALETSIFLRWVLCDKSDLERKMRYFHVWRVRDALDSTRRLIRGTPEHARLGAHMNSLPSFNDVETGTVIQNEAKAHEAHLVQLLSLPENKSISAEFARARGNKKYESAWYRPLGMHNLAAIAESIGMCMEYRTFYSSFSEVTHGLNYERHIHAKKGHLEFEPVRSPIGAPVLFRVCNGLALGNYRSFVSFFYPADSKDLAQKYSAEWRQDFLVVPTLVVEDLPDGRISYKVKYSP